MTQGRPMFNQLINKKYYKVLALTLASTCCISITHAAVEQFNDALQASNSGNLSLLQQYRSSME
ncbi:hypothetical protein L0P02_14285, partial [Bifidobacterium longum]|nr:hypothetical protein [Bifidobacterium longum]